MIDFGVITTLVNNAVITVTVILFCVASILSALSILVRYLFKRDNSIITDAVVIGISVALMVAIEIFKTLLEHGNIKYLAIALSTVACVIALHRAFMDPGHLNEVIGR